MDFIAEMFLRVLPLLVLALSAFVHANDFAGANSYFLYAVSVGDMLSAYQSLTKLLTCDLGQRQDSCSGCYAISEHETSVEYHRAECC